MLSRSTFRSAIKHGKLQDLCFVCCFVVLLCLSFVKCQYGRPSIDEIFHLLIPYRFYNGDIPVIYETHPSQISTIWVYPLMSFYLRFVSHGSTEGIVIAFRYFFTLFWSINSLFVYLRLRKYAKYGAICSLFLMIYVPFGMMSLYYNTIGLMTLISSCIIILTAKTRLLIQYSIAGILFAVAVTCTPFLIILYMLLTVIALGACVKGQALLSKIWIGISIGSFGTLMVFSILLFSLSHGRFTAVLEHLPDLMTDGEHPFDILKIVSIFSSIYEENHLYLYLFAICIILCMISILNKKAIVRSCGIMILLLSVGTVQIYNVLYSNYINHFMFAPLFLGLYCYTSFDNKQIKALFYSVWIPGVIYVFCLYLTSNTGFKAVSSAATIPSLASLIMVVIAVSENTKIYRKISTVMLVAFLVFSFSVMSYLRFSFVYYDYSISSMVCKADFGIHSNLYLTESYYSEIQNLYAVFKQVDERLDPTNILILSPSIWGYLEISAGIGTYTTWYNNTNAQELYEFYNTFQDKTPDVIFIDANNISIHSYFEEMGYCEYRNDPCGLIMVRQ